MTPETHAAAVAASILRDARERDQAAADYFDREIRPDVFARLAARFPAGRPAFAPPPGPDRPARRLYLGESAWRQTDLDDDKLSEPLKWAGAAAAVRQKQAERFFEENAREETGAPAGPKAAKQKHERAELLAQSHALAQRLEAAGVPAYRKDGTSLWIWWVCSQQAEELPKFRRICFLPSIAAQVRAGKLAALEHFLARNPFCRFWTFTSGRRVGLDGLRGRIQWLHRRLNALNQFLRRHYSVELVFRSTELGTVEFDEHGNGRGDNAGRIETDENGNPLFHPHAHCLVQSLRGFIPPAEWAEMFAAIWEFWRDDDGNQLNWDGGRRGQPGTIRNARECCKYVTKPGDLLRLTAEQLRATEAALHGLKLVQPLGELKAEIAARKAAGKILVRVPTPDGPVWAEKIDWNKFAEETEEERFFRENVADAQLFARETKAAALVKPPQAPAPIDPSSPWCRVFARLAPAVGPRWVKEPRAVVGGNVFNAAQVAAHPLVSRLWAQTVQQFEAGLALAEAATQAEVDGIRVHTGTPSATAGPSGRPDWPEEPGETWENARPLTLKPSR